MAKISKLRTSGPILPCNVTFPRQKSIATVIRRLLSHAVPAPTAAHTNQSAIRPPEVVGRDRIDTMPQPVKTRGTIASRQIGKVRGRMPRTPDHTRSRSKG
jgi:hypothetical protein